MTNGLQIMEMRANGSAQRRTNQKIAQFVVSALFFVAKAVAVIGIGVMIGMYIA